MEYKTRGYVLVLLIISLIGIFLVTYKPINVNSNSSEEIVIIENKTGLIIGQITHKSCSGKTLNVYENCHNIKEQAMMLTWDTPDRTDDISGISILKSGLIEIKIYKRKSR